MNKEQILALLTKKFSGERKDGLELFASSLMLTHAFSTEEEAQAVIDKLEASKVKDFIKGFRSGVDRETSESIKTNEQKLREKYNFVEKTESNPPTPPTPPADPNAAAIAAAVEKAIAPLQAEIATLKGGAASKERKAQVEALFNGLNVPESYKKTVLSSFDVRTFENDETFNTYLEATKQELADFQQEMNDKGFSNDPSPIFGSPNNDGVSSAVAQYIADKAKADESNITGKAL